MRIIAFPPFPSYLPSGPRDPRGSLPLSPFENQGLQVTTWGPELAQPLRTHPRPALLGSTSTLPLQT